MAGASATTAVRPLVLHSAHDHHAFHEDAKPGDLAGQFGTRRFSTSKKLMTRMSGNYTTAIKDSGQLTTTCDKTTENRGRMPVGPEGRTFVIKMPMILSTGSIRNSVP